VLCAGVASLAAGNGSGGALGWGGPAGGAAGEGAGGGKAADGGGVGVPGCAALGGAGSGAGIGSAGVAGVGSLGAAGGSGAGWEGTPSVCAEAPHDQLPTFTSETAPKSHDDQRSIGLTLPRSCLELGAFHVAEAHAEHPDGDGVERLARAREVISLVGVLERRARR
jgi:hypothetical protein